MELNTGKWIALVVAVALLSFAAAIGVCFLMNNPTSENVKSVTVDPTPEKTEPVKVWTEGEQVETVDSEDEIPEFPDELVGYSAMPKGTDFWGEPFKSPSSVRVFEGGPADGKEDDWTRVENGNGDYFPKTMNGCGAGIWLMRWRSNNDDVVVEAGVGYIGDVKVVELSKEGRYGYMQSSNCYEPLFRFKKAINGNSSSLVDVLYEVKFFEARP